MNDNYSNSFSHFTNLIKLTESYSSWINGLDEIECFIKQKYQTPSCDLDFRKFVYALLDLLLFNDVKKTEDGVDEPQKGLEEVRQRVIKLFTIIVQYPLLKSELSDLPQLHISLWCYYNMIHLEEANEHAKQVLELLFTLGEFNGGEAHPVFVSVIKNLLLSLNPSHEYVSTTLGCLRNLLVSSSVNLNSLLSDLIFEVNDGKFLPETLKLIYLTLNSENLTLKEASLYLANFIIEQKFVSLEGFSLINLINRVGNLRANDSNPIVAVKFLLNVFKNYPNETIAVLANSNDTLENPFVNVSQLLTWSRKSPANYGDLPTLSIKLLGLVFKLLPQQIVSVIVQKTDLLSIVSNHLCCNVNTDNFGLEEFAVYKLKYECFSLLSILGQLISITTTAASINSFLETVLCVTNLKFRQLRAQILLLASLLSENVENLLTLNILSLLQKENSKESTPSLIAGVLLSGSCTFSSPFPVDVSSSASKSISTHHMHIKVYEEIAKEVGQRCKEKYISHHPSFVRQLITVRSDISSSANDNKEEKTSDLIVKDLLQLKDVEIKKLRSLTATLQKSLMEVNSTLIKTFDSSEQSDRMLQESVILLDNEEEQCKDLKEQCKVLKAQGKDLKEQCKDLEELLLQTQTTLEDKTIVFSKTIQEFKEKLTQKDAIVVSLQKELGEVKDEVINFKHELNKHLELLQCKERAMSLDKDKINELTTNLAYERGEKKKISKDNVELKKKIKEMEDEITTQKNNLEQISKILHQK